jgi:hypothetical protein
MYVKLLQLVRAYALRGLQLLRGNGADLRAVELALHSLDSGVLVVVV